MSEVQINPKRLEYMLERHSMGRAELIELLNQSQFREKPYAEEEIFGDAMLISALRRVNEILGGGLSFYTDPTDIDQSESRSIFFRKSKFNADLKPIDRVRVIEFEDRIEVLDYIMRAAEIRAERGMEVYKPKDDPAEVALKVRDDMLTESKHGTSDDKAYLSNLVNAMGEHNILVTEFIETKRKEERKTSLEGIFISPRFIWVKRNSKAYKREILTLLHELGHYLLDKEELDVGVEDNQAGMIERWCFRFACAFLLGEKGLKAVQQLADSRIEHNNEDIKRISSDCHIGRVALLTHLRDTEVIGRSEYLAIRDALQREWDERTAEFKSQQDQETESQQDRPMRRPKPIHSDFEKEIYSVAYLKGILEEYDVLKQFDIDSSEKFDELVYG